MSEVELEGVLSEAVLDELAADLGIESDVLRKHPFFRVYRGRILLTYPLKVYDDVDVIAAIAAIPKWSLYVYGPTSLANGAFFVPAAGTVVHIAILDVAAAIAAEGKFYWSEVETAHNLMDSFLSPVAVNKNVLAFVVACDGTNVRLRNNTGGALDLKLQGLTFG